MTAPELMTAEEIAKLCRVPYRTVAEAARLCLIPHYALPEFTRFDASDARRLLSINDWGAIDAAVEDSLLRQKEARISAFRAYMRPYHAKRRARKRAALPAWADLAEIRKVYEQCEALTAATGVAHHVDHIVPLQGKTVCGLHVHYNLRAIPAEENLRKKNRLEE